MGYLDIELPNKLFQSKVANFELRRESSLRLTTPTCCGAAFCTELKCGAGIFPKSLGGFSWQRFECDIPIPEFKQWELQSPFAQGDLLQHEGSYFQATSSERPEESWIEVKQLPYLIVCLRPRESQQEIRIAPFRRGVKQSRVDREAKIADWLDDFHNGIQNVSMADRMRLAREEFLRWFENQGSDWSYSDGNQLRAGFHEGFDELESYRRNHIGLIMGVFFCPVDLAPEEYVQSLVTKNWASQEIVQELEKSSSSCQSEQEPPAKNAKNYRFWPKVAAKALVDNHPNSDATKWSLFSEQYQQIDEAMKLALTQSLCGPDKTDERPGHDYWDMKSTNELALKIYRDRLFANWKRIAAARKQKDAN